MTTTADSVTPSRLWPGRFLRPFVCETSTGTDGCMGPWSTAPQTARNSFYAAQVDRPDRRRLLWCGGKRPYKIAAGNRIPWTGRRGRPPETISYSNTRACIARATSASSFRTKYINNVYRTPRNRWPSVHTTRVRSPRGGVELFLALAVWFYNEFSDVRWHSIKREPNKQETITFSTFFPTNYFFGY